MLNRRTFLTQSMLSVAAAKLALAAPASAPVLVQTASGPLRGVAEGNVNIFRGVPFAQPPVGPLRFRAPVPVSPWSDVRDATRFSAAPMQPNAPNLPQSEDCLYLNLWAPQTQGPHPVFVWIHGGGFTGGHAFEATYDGSDFAREGIVCITVAYRLGVFGFLDLGPILGAGYEGSANNALRDLVMALTWISRNVAAFGGDPQRVTIGGESAGAKLTDMLMGVPSAQPLFHQMISESGGAERIWPAAQAAAIANGFSTQWTSSSAGRAVAQLKTAPARDLLAAQDQFLRDWPVHFPLRTEIDGTLISKSPLETIRAGSTRGKRLLIGTNRDESALFIGPHPAQEPGKRDLGNLSVEQYRAVEQQYAQLYLSMTDEQRWIRSLTAEEYWVPSTRVAEAHVYAGGEAFVYLLEFAPSSGRFAGQAFHSYDVRFVWNHFGPDGSTPEELHFAAMVHAAWASFIRGEAPHATGLPTWPRYATSTRPTMILDTVSRIENAPQAQELAAWTGLLTQ